MKKILLSVILILCLGINYSRANTIEVQNTDDSSVGSLRQSIIDANNGDTIRFNSNLISAGSSTIFLSSEITFSKELVFKGLYNSSDTLYISGNSTNRIFSITNSVKASLDSMVFINGNVVTGNGGALSIEGVDSVFFNNSHISNCTAEFSGGIDFRTNNTNNQITSNIYLNINNSSINNNSSLGSGGGIHIGGSNITLTINNSTISNNSSTNLGDGGGISAFTFYDGSVTINNSNINNNQVSSGNGGGLKVESFYTDFYTTIDNSTFDNNTASGTGGGVYSTSSETSSVIVANSTFSNNSADIAGGIYSGNSNSGNSVGIVSLSNSTISDNHATNDIGGIYVAGNSADFTAINSTIYGNSTATSFNKCGGVQVFGTAFGTANSTINITSSIVWTSVGDNIKHLTVDSGGNIVNTQPLISGGYNIFNDTPNGANGTGDLTNVSDADLDLQGLANNGGTTLTMQPNLGSVAINAGNLNDLSDAQNMPIIGIRDIGSTERSNTIVLVSSINVQGQGGANTITIDDGTLQMEATVLPANADDGTYTWSVVNGTGTASIDANGLLTALTNGTVDVVATANDASGITGMTTITISNQTVGINEANGLLSGVEIYPNPVQNQLFIDGLNGQINQLEIIDHSGRIIFSILDKNVKNINVSNLNQGMYILKISTEKGISTKQFIKK